MCESCVARPKENSKRRHKLWEIRPDLHCSILGTCLSYADLLKIGRKAGFVPAEQATEYEVHKYFVHRAEEPSRLARLMHKALDGKYRAAIRACQEAQGGADLEEFWSDALAKGDIPGPYWVLMTHPLTTEALLIRAFGEVHMLSHLTGAANRADVRRLRGAEAALADARRRLSAQATEHSRAAAQHAGQVAGLERRLRAAEADGAERAAAQARLGELESGAAHRALVRTNATLTADLEAARRACESAQARCGNLEQEVSALRHAKREATASLEALRNECSALEALVSADVNGAAAPAQEEAPAIDLCGRRIAYVGGRAGTVSHFRTVVKSLNGRFSHHDGGVDDNIGRLGGVLSQADVVLCPVDCVSHGACLKAKTFCKQAAKPFVPLRTAGLSSLVRGLYQFAAENS